MMERSSISSLLLSSLIALALFSASCSSSTSDGSPSSGGDMGLGGGDMGLGGDLALGGTAGVAGVPLSAGGVSGTPVEQGGAPVAAGGWYIAGDTGLGGAADLGGATADLGGNAALGGATADVGGGTGLGGAADVGGGGGETAAGGATAPCPTLPSPQITYPDITDFESLGTADDPPSWVFVFNDDAFGGDGIYAGPFLLPDSDAGLDVMAAVAGNASSYALGVSNATATVWGGGFGLWMSCFDASLFTGIQFDARGSAPADASFQISDLNTTPAADLGDCVATVDTTVTDACIGPSYTFPLSTTWTTITIPWNQLVGKDGGGLDYVPTGANIHGMTFVAHLEFALDEATQTWLAVPAAYSIEIDNLAFYSL